MYWCLHILVAIYQKLQNLLFDVGFSEAEVCLYIELLKKPLLRVWELVQKTGLSKSTVYDAFSKLKKLQMVEKTGDGIRALSLKALVAELNRNKKRLDKTAYKIKQIAPFLRVPNETVEEFETLYTPEQIREAYILMSEIPYSMNLDFGDFENFITAMGGNQLHINSEAIEQNTLLNMVF